MAVRRWKTAESHKELSRALAAELGIAPFSAHLLINRGIDTPEKCRAFLGVDGEPFVDPFLLPDMDKAVERIERALADGEPIMIYGDYDVDGVTATSLIYTYLKERGADVSYMLPSRDEDGYGLNRNAIDRINERGVTLIVTVDNGVSAVEEIEYAQTLGIDVVVTDHHKPPEIVPDAYAVVDAFLPSGDGMPFREWAGVGVAFKLASALEGGGEEAGAAVCERFGDLIALGSIADVVPLKGENRRLVRRGVEVMRKGSRLGTQALLRASRITPGCARAVDVSFQLAPRINSAGRMGKPDRAVEMFISEDAAVAELLADELTNENQRRGLLEAQMSGSVWESFHAHPERMLDRVVVVCGEGWNTGVVGIFAGKLSEMLSKPVIVLSTLADNPELSRGSGRCFGDFSLHEALTKCQDLLVAYGGHRLAAGMTIRTKDIPRFIEEINRCAAEFALEHGDMPVQELTCDCELDPRHIDLRLAHSCDILEPFGAGNAEPRIMIRNVEIKNIIQLTGGKHHRLVVSRSSRPLSLLYFRSDSKYMRYRIGDRIDVIVTMQADVYNGQEQLKLIVQDIRPSGLDAEDVIAGERLYESLMRGEKPAAEQLERLTPSREQLASVYRLFGTEGYCGSKEILAYRAAQCGVSYGRLLMAMRAMAECGIIEIVDTGSAWTVHTIPSVEKVCLENSPVFRKLLDKAETDTANTPT